jgi:hypothetical protein
MGDQKDYRIKQGKRYDRVTSITGMIAYSGMMELGKKIGFEKVDEIMRTAGDRGRKFHEYCGLALKGKLSDDMLQWVRAENHKMHDNLMQFIKWSSGEMKKVIISEKRYFDDKRLICGKPDIVAELKDGKTHLIDIKSSSKIYRSHFMQLAAYDYLLRENGIKVHDCMILHIYSGRLKVHTMDTPESKIMNMAFNNLLMAKRLIDKSNL